nr:MAG TPA: hypothetical protein [Caudoviricetes sp.]
MPLCLLIPGAKLHFELLEKFQRFNFTLLCKFQKVGNLELIFDGKKSAKIICK